MIIYIIIAPGCVPNGACLHLQRQVLHWSACDLRRRKLLKLVLKDGRGKQPNEEEEEEEEEGVGPRREAGREGVVLLHLTCSSVQALSDQPCQLADWPKLWTSKQLYTKHKHKLTVITVCPTPLTNLKVDTPVVLS